MLARKEARVHEKAGDTTATLPRMHLHRRCGSELDALLTAASLAEALSRRPLRHFHGHTVQRAPYLP